MIADADLHGVWQLLEAAQLPRPLHGHEQQPPGGVVHRLITAVGCRLAAIGRRRRGDDRRRVVVDA